MTKVERQRENEAMMVSKGVERYRRNVRLARDRKKERGETDLEHKWDATESRSQQPDVISDVFMETIEPLAEKIKSICENPPKGWVSRNMDLIKYLRLFEPEEVACLTAQATLNGIAMRQTLTKICMELCGLLEDLINFKQFKAQNPGLFRYQENKVQKIGVYARRRYTTLRLAKQHHISLVKWGTDLKLKLGINLVHQLCETTGHFDIEAQSDGKGGKDFNVETTEAFMKRIDEGHEFYEVLAPVFYPMITPPKPWTDVKDGGYLLDELREQASMVKTRSKAYLEEVAQAHDISPVLDPMNAVQATSWRINKPILNVMDIAWKAGGGQYWGLPAQQGAPLPLCPLCGQKVESRRGEHPCFDESEVGKEGLKQWKRAAAPVHEENIRRRSKRMSQDMKLTIAKRFCEEPELYFPHSMDWRGRMYPMPTYVNPQMDDSGRALLEFAEGRPITTDGLRWLKIHTANSFGIDKVSLDDRVKWFDEHEAQILATAANPIDNRFWTEADKPYTALAACFDYAGYKADPAGHLSHLPISMDGSCNGLQNFSAMLLDEVGGTATNLVPQNKPADIYQQVADLVAAKVAEDAETSEDEKIQKCAKAWLGQVTRKIVKRNVMTLPYGATKYGMREQIVAELKDQADKGKVIIKDKDLFPYATYLADIVYDKIGQVVIAAREAMDWLKATAKIVSENELPVKWTTPMGFPVVQDYKRSKVKQLNIAVLGTKRYSPKIRLTQDKIDKVRNTNGISPNFVHSLDAAHLQRTVSKCLAEGIDSFGMVHDSYATHACNASTMARVLREAFIEQYSQDVLAGLRDQLAAQLIASGREDLADKIPALPKKGSLNLENVRKSLYFFA